MIPQAPKTSRSGSASSPKRRTIDRIIEIDLKLSKPIFEWTLPFWQLEFLLSIPGNLVGPPVLQVVAPFWIFWLHLNLHVRNCNNNNKNYAYDYDAILTLFVAVTSSSLLLVIPWIFFLRGHVSILSRFLFANVTFALSPLIGVAISYSLGAYYQQKFASCTNDATGTTPIVNSSALCFHYIWLYNSSCSIILLLKHGTQRKRPCCYYYQQSAPKSPTIGWKHFPVIPRTLKHSAPDTSFPSGDVMAATAFALPLLYLGYFYTAILLVALTAVGRVYFLAHHLLDTIVGMMVALTFHTAAQCDYFHVGFKFPPPIGSDQWYHPLGAVGALAIASKFRRNDQK